jgi:hypothetical protein
MPDHRRGQSRTCYEDKECFVLPCRIGIGPEYEKWQAVYHSVKKPVLESHITNVRILSGCDWCRSVWPSLPLSWWSWEWIDTLAWTVSLLASCYLVCRSICFSNKIKLREETHHCPELNRIPRLQAKQLELTAASVVSLQGRLGRKWQVLSKRQRLSHLTEWAHLAENFNDDKMIWCACKKALQSTWKVSTDEVALLKLLMYKQDSVLYGLQFTWTLLQLLRQEEKIRLHRWSQNQSSSVPVLGKRKAFLVSTAYRVV